MKIAFKHQAINKTNSAVCSITEYNLNNEKIDMAIATITGRYPNERRAVNLQSDELAYVIEGKGKVVVNHQEYKLATGDTVLIEAGEKYYWEGDMKLFICCNPAWKSDQHQSVD